MAICDVDPDISVAIKRVIRSWPRGRTLHIHDVIAALRFTLPDQSFDAATVFEHLQTMMSEGYVPPVMIAADE